MHNSALIGRKIKLFLSSYFLFLHACGLYFAYVRMFSLASRVCFSMSMYVRVQYTGESVCLTENECVWLKECLVKLGCLIEKCILNPRHVEE